MIARLFSCALLFALSGSLLAEAPRVTLYDPDPTHLWNQIHAEMWMRTAPDGTFHAANDLDLPLNDASRAPLKGDDTTLSLLREFVGQPPEEFAQVEPLKRAWMQRNLWALFDWTVELPTHLSEKERALKERAQILQPILAKAIQNLALTNEEIAALPDPYRITLDSAKYSTSPPSEGELPYLPEGFEDDSGRWSFVHPISATVGASLHFQFFSNRSTFYIAARLPVDGPSAADYLAQLRDFRPSWIPSKVMSPSGPTLPHGGIHSGVEPNPETPQFPPGTQWALIRKAMLINTDGEIVTSPLVESIQVRTYRTVEKHGSNQAFAELLLDPEVLLKGDPAPLTAQDGTERVLRGFLHHEIHDPYEGSLEEWTAFSQPRRKGLRCVTCHSGWGIHGVNSRAQLLTVISVERPILDPVSFERIEAQHAREKKRLYDWGVLEGIWIAQDPDLKPVSVE